MLEPIIAYIDPVAGATIMQLVLAGTIGIGALVKLRWQSIKKALGRADKPSADLEESQKTMM